MNTPMRNVLKQCDNTPVVLQGANNEVRITSVELVELINTFRKEEGNQTEKRHSDLMTSIATEIKALDEAGIPQRNFSLGLYKDKQNQERPCYSMNKAGALQMLNKESAVVRYKTTQYIEKLERALKEKRSKPNAPTLMELIQFIQLTREQMKEQGCSPREIAKVTQEICNQYGIQLPKYFIKPEETTLREVYAMIDYICDQPRGRGIRRPTYEDFIAHQINMRLIP